MKLFWKILRITLFIAGSFSLFYGVSSCIVPEFGFHIGLSAAGFTSILVSFLMASGQDVNPKQ